VTKNERRSRQRSPAPRRPDVNRLLIVSALAAVAVTGCQGADRLSKREYEQKVRSEYADVQAAFRSTGDARGHELAMRIETAQGQLRHAADELEHAEPPKDVEEENEEIVEGMREYAADLDVLHVAAEKGNQPAIEAFNDRIAENKAVARIAEAAEEMKFKGYDLGQVADE
jgi:hypothetical protein